MEGQDMPPIMPRNLEVAIPLRNKPKLNLKQTKINDFFTKKRRPSLG